MDPLEAVTAIDSPLPIPECSLGSSLWEAIRGSHQDYTTGSLNRTILLLAVPMVLEIPLAYWLAIPMRLHSNGVFFSIVIAETAIAGASTALFKRGKWKT